ncbi:unnamed protein product [Caenorhabditis angaria]|uniref:Uncharacterized protein n=1 Tax=Caenorhabditis angaria TaxID=860376 RepID=A0A9P1J2L2_9PELO|nr:unnamed protein product [Caenorhabditis angaria]
MKINPSFLVTIAGVGVGDLNPFDEPNTAGYDMIFFLFSEHYSRFFVMFIHFFSIWLILQVSVVNSQLTIEDWFFPVSVAPPADVKDNTIYDDEVNSSPEPETINKTNQQIKDYYEKDKWDKWNNQKPILQPVFKQNSIEEDLNINKSPRFLPNSEPVIIMSMTPINNTMQPEEITKIIETTVMATTSEIITTTLPTTTTNSNSIAIQKDYEFKKMRKDIFRLRNEMNLVKALLNKLYKRSYKKHRDFIPKKMHDSEVNRNHDSNDDKWIVVDGKLRRQKH